MGETRYMHWTHSAVAPSLGGRRCPMDSDEVLASEILGHGAYLCLRRSSGGDAGKAAAAPIDALAQRPGLPNQLDPGETPPVPSLAFLRRPGAPPADTAHRAALPAAPGIHGPPPPPRALPAARHAPCPGRRLRLSHVLRVRRPRRDNLPPGLCRAPRHQAQSRVAIRPRGTDLARPPRRVLEGALLMMTTDRWTEALDRSRESV